MLGCIPKSLSVVISAHAPFNSEKFNQQLDLMQKGVFLDVVRL